MTGFRVGWLRAHPEIVEVAAKLQEPFVSCGVPFSQAAVTEVLKGGQVTKDLSLEICKTYKARRDAALQVMEDNGIKADYIPAGAFYMLVNTGVADSTDFCLKLLKEKHVAVAPGDTFGKNGAGYVRIALA